MANWTDNAMQGGTACDVDKVNDNLTYLKDSIDNLEIPTPKFEGSLLHIQDQKASGTGGGSFANSSWQTRVLNTVLTNEITGASLSSDTITLPAGTYFCEGWATAYYCNLNKAKLRKTNGTATDILIGSSEVAGASIGFTSKSHISGRFELTEESTIILQHYCNTEGGSYGLATSITGVVEVYSDIKIWQISAS